MDLAIQHTAQPDAYEDARPLATEGSRAVASPALPQPSATEEAQLQPSATGAAAVPKPATGATTLKADNGMLAPAAEARAQGLAADNAALQRSKGAFARTTFRGRKLMVHEEYTNPIAFSYHGMIVLIFGYKDGTTEVIALKPMDPWFTFTSGATRRDFGRLAEAVGRKRGIAVVHAGRSLELWAGSQAEQAEEWSSVEDRIALARAPECDLGPIHAYYDRLVRVLRESEKRRAAEVRLVLSAISATQRPSCPGCPNCTN